MSGTERRHFVGEAIQPSAQHVDTGAPSRGEPPLPRGFTWRREQLSVREVLRTWRSTKNDRGDTYLERHWYEVALEDGRVAVIYFDRSARRGHPRWWLYSVTSSESSAS